MCSCPNFFGLPPRDNRDIGNHYGPEGTEYVALRGVANLADQFETQGDFSVAVLTDALRNAASLLQVDHSESLPETASSLNGPSVCI